MVSTYPSTKSGVNSLDGFWESKFFFWTTDGQTTDDGGWYLPHIIFFVILISNALRIQVGDKIRYVFWIGPLLFLIFINDLPCLQKCATDLFADDSMSYPNGTSNADIQDDRQIDVNNISKWFKDNRLTADVHTCGSMMIGTRQRLESDFNLDVKINNEVVCSLTEYDHLGLKITNTLS